VQDELYGAPPPTHGLFGALCLCAALPCLPLDVRRLPCVSLCFLSVFVVRAGAGLWSVASGVPPRRAQAMWSVERWPCVLLWFAFVMPAFLLCDLLLVAKIKF
jgi:hypothetical protein